MLYSKYKWLHKNNSGRVYVIRLPQTLFLNVVKMWSIFLHLKNFSSFAQNNNSINFRGKNHTELKNEYFRWWHISIQSFFKYFSQDKYCSRKWSRIGLGRIKSTFDMGPPSSWSSSFQDDIVKFFGVYIVSHLSCHLLYSIPYISSQTHKMNPKIRIYLLSANKRGTVERNCRENRVVWRTKKKPRRIYGRQYGHHAVRPFIVLENGEKKVVTFTLLTRRRKNVTRVKESVSRI